MITIKGSKLQKFLLLIQIVLLISAIVIDIVMNVKNIENDGLASMSKGFLYFSISLGLIIPFLEKGDEKEEEKNKNENENDNK